MNFFEEVEMHHAQKQKEKKAPISQLNFNAGLLIGFVSVLVLMCLVGFTGSSFTFGNEKSFEATLLQLDSIQIQQNKRIIELLEVNTKRDTTIVHVIAPAF